MVVLILIRLFSPIIILSISIVILGTLIRLRRINWVGVWVGMEINLFGFLIFMNPDGLCIPEPCIKYFVVQSRGSMLLIIGFLTLDFFYSIVSIILIISGVLVKSGVFPFHSWVPLVIKNCTWLRGGIVLTWQKLAPLVLIGVITPNFMIGAIVFFMAIIGGVGGLNQLSVRLIIAYSSFVHTSWIVCSLSSSFLAFFCYFIIYRVSVSLFFWCCAVINKHKVRRKVGRLTGRICLIMLRGVPPFLGFLGKIVVFLSVGSILVIPCILGSAISLKYYLRFFYRILMSRQLDSYYYGVQKIIFLVIMLNFFGLVLVLIFLFGVWLLSFVAFWFRLKKYDLFHESLREVI